MVSHWPHWTGDRYIELKYIVKCTGRAWKLPLWAGDHYIKVTVTTGLTVVKPVYHGNLGEIDKMTTIYKWPLYEGFWFFDKILHASCK
jgi:hypothetical protein